MGWEDGDPLADMTSLHIILPEVDKWCKNTPMFHRKMEIILDYRFVGHWTVRLIISTADGPVEYEGRDDDFATAILKAVVAAGGEG